MNCCLTDLERAFSPRTARRDLRRYRRRGPLPATRRLLAAIRREGPVDDRTLLDIGGGVGAIPHELLDEGLACVDAVDASSAYLDANREEAERRGHAARMTFHHGDFTALEADLPEADIVTLDRVICCYPDMERLVAASTRKARQLYGLVYPRERWWVRLVLRGANLTFRIRRCGFRVYLHQREAVDGLVRDLGFEPCYEATTIIWRVVLYSRIAP
jgi:SAM-dependent methyltransferase